MQSDGVIIEAFFDLTLREPPEKLTRSLSFKLVKKGDRWVSAEPREIWSISNDELFTRAYKIEILERPLC